MLMEQILVKEKNSTNDVTLITQSTHQQVDIAMPEKTLYDDCTPNQNKILASKSANFALIFSVNSAQ